MQNTSNLGLKKPETNEYINISDLNENADIIDAAMNTKVTVAGGDISETVIETLKTIETQFPVPSAGEDSKTFLGKVKRFIQDFNDFKTGVLTLGHLVNNGQTTEPGFALDARYGKTLYDLYAQLNANLASKSLVTVPLLLNSSVHFIKHMGMVYLTLNLSAGDIPALPVYERVTLPIRIPEGFYPVYNLFFIKLVIDNREQEGAFLNIHADGTIEICTRYNTLFPNTYNLNVYGACNYRAK
ncbi:MAG: hypothetical protein QM657_17790 [Lacrimispora sp.]|uniref:hypothetical protein n=1 Tax=Lacrimispora sp. TaxID=2719234 RepID=UPI0039E6296F